MSKRVFFLSPIFVLILAFNQAVQGQIANLYPHDIGIENDSNVLFVEKFDDGLPAILSRYDDKRNAAGMSIDADVPPGSLDPNSINMTSTQGGISGGHLFKRFTPGFDSIVYLRYYVKYPSISQNYFHHESVWFGGYNPSTAWPNPQAGTCGLSDSRLSIAYEPVHQGMNPPGYDSYLYWGDMQSWNGGGSCYGNDMVNGSPTEQYVAFDQWTCVEVMIKLNNPVTAYNGELRIWQDGVEVGHWGQGFPNGHWNVDSWINNPNDPPFPGFRWRTNDSLNINWIWIEFYHDDPNAPSSYIKFDHLVMAKEYIGPISVGTGVDDNDNDNDNDSDNDSDNDNVAVFPVPSTGVFNFERCLSQIESISVYTMTGHFILSTNERKVDLSLFPNGIYEYRIQCMGGKLLHGLISKTGL